MSTHIEIYGQSVTALLAVPGTGNPSPVAMLTLVVIHQLLPRLGHPRGSLAFWKHATEVVTIHHHVGSFEQSVVIPLRAVASLPGGGT